ncbi:rab11 family-interacting protein 1 isoform X4 [Nerophis lumbriciformis]|uniref:rab11 family-interacting protein 1 isoform X4 n=1 Tax=Nerophis lumbriciformis TaxID=546530 RepID=UPI002AE00E87|nr:rab11 family-interacting protein 2-like isoform X4 [Nerophis lumbriciformis]
MSLVDSSQQWFPTSVQVTVHQARNLRAKGKHDSNDAYAIIQVAKDKFSTSVVEKSKAPIWKEEASFDLPLFHPGNVDRCTLYLVVMHRVQGGLDKFLGQAVVNLLDLHENTARHKPAWFPLVDKNGKADKLRGDVLLGISFMRINMSASMVDLSTQEKHRSRLSKLSAKLRPKKQRSLTDSNSDIMPPVDQVLTDSEGEHDSVSLQFNQTPEEKNKSKVKKFFSLNSNLKRKTFQPHAPFGTQIEKNSSRSSSRSSGINVETPEAKKKFKFPGHKRSGSSDSKVSLGALSLLSRSKRSNSDLNDVGVNGNQKYEDAKSGSSLSLNSSGQGSVENVHQHTTGAPVLSFRSESQNIMMEKLSHQEEEERRQMEARSMAEAVRLQEEEEEERRRAEALILQEELTQNEEFDRNRHFLEDEARLEQLREEEEERARLEAAEDEERLGLEEQTQRAEDQKRQEEASMSERLSSLFGMLRKKEEKKEETQQYPKEELTTQAPHDGDGSFVSSNQLEDISLSSSPQFNNSERLYDDQKPNLNPRTPSAMLFLNRTPKVSTVKPRPHPVKPMHSTESQVPINSYALKDLHVSNGTAGKVKTQTAGLADSGPFTQLTHEELITLVVRQQADLSKKESQISELEEYIDNLLVRVIEEKPAILQALKGTKPV